MRREAEVHLGGCLGARGELEDDADAVDDLLLAGAGDVHGRRDEGHGAGGAGGAQTAADLPLRSLGELRSVHVDGATGHGGPRVDVVADRVAQEAGRREHRNGVVVGRQDAACAAEVLAVRVGVDQAGDRPVAAVLAVELQGRGGGLGGDERVDDDDAVVALDQCHVGQVQTAGLVDALRDLVQALPAHQPALPPQALVRGVGAVSGQEAVGLGVPDHPAVVRGDLGRVERGDEATVGVGEVLVVIHGCSGHGTLPLRGGTQSTDPCHRFNLICAVIACVRAPVPGGVHGEPPTPVDPAHRRTPARPR